jgi:hypothetical protein
MTEPFSYDDTQFVADTINRETVEQAHAILTGLIERGWTPPPAAGGPVDPASLYRVGEDRGCGYLTPGQLAADMERFNAAFDTRARNPWPTPRLEEETPPEPKIAGVGTEDTTP